jgi:GT2 family glycosyltransferase
MAPVVENSVPSVLAVVVVHDAERWLRRTLAALARQTHPRFGVLAVDSGSADGSAEILQSVLGKGRVLRLGENVGFPAAVQRALSVPAAAEADFVLLMHDDTVLATEAVARMVEAAGRVPGVGLVGPKVLDSERPGVLLEIGQASDRFGNPYTPLEDGEIDQGQYDATREVLYVSSAAMLVARDAWRRAGLFDERLRTGHGDLDFGWRIRLAGFRVLMVPRAVALHRLAGRRGERDGTGPDRERYLAERAGLMSVLKNFRFLTLLWVLPLYAAQGLVRLVTNILGRHFDRVGQMLRAWGWNIVHLPGTVRRRARAQAVRHTGDRDIAQFMAPAGTGLRRWALRASSVLVARGAAHAEEDEEPEIQPLRRRVRSLVVAHPAGVGLLVGVVLTLIAFRGVLFVPRIEGGAFPTFPSGPFEFFREFASSWRSTGFGGQGGGSPALVPLGAASVLTLGNPDLLGRLLVAFGPLAAGISCHRALRRLRLTPTAAVAGAACYGLSALPIWAASEGRIATIVVVVALPAIGVRLWATVDDRLPGRPLPRAVGTGMLLALVGSFFPAIWIAAALLFASALVLPGRGGNALRGVVLTLLSAAIAAVLVFPFTAELAATGGGAGVDGAGAGSFLSILRLSPGASPGSSPAAFFLPLAGFISFALVTEGNSRRAWRGLLVALTAVPLAWLAAAGHLPAALGNPVAFLAAGAVAMSFLVGLAADSAVAGMTTAAFGTRHLAVAALGAVVLAGILGQAGQAIGGGWAVGESRVSPAWPLVSGDHGGGPFRVLWLGAPGAEAFPAPGGDPQGIVASGRGSASYGISGPGGRSALATGLPADGLGYEHLRDVLAAMLSGRVRHGGALLGPLGIRYVVTGDVSVPPAVTARLESQIDLDLLQSAAGLRIYRNSRALPIGAAIPGSGALSAARSGDLLAPVRLPGGVAPLQPNGPERWSGEVDESGLVLLAVDDAPGWIVEDEPGFLAFGWAVGAEAGPGPVGITYRGGLRRPIELGAMALLWAMALWVVRKRPAPRGRLAARERAVFPDPVPVRGRAG